MTEILRRRWGSHLERICGTKVRSPFLVYNDGTVKCVRVIKNVVKCVRRKVTQKIDKTNATSRGALLRVALFRRDKSGEKLTV